MGLSAAERYEASSYWLNKVQLFGLRHNFAEELSGGGIRGLVFDADDSGALAAHILSLTADGARWAKMAADAREFSREMTLDRFADRVREMLEDQWSVRLPDPAGPAT